MSDVAGWLAGLGLAQYADAFAAEDVDVSVLPALSDQDLRDLGVASLGHRRKIMAAARALGSPARPALAPPREGAERRPITVMFCDLVGSTDLAARLDAEDWRDLVGAYLDAASKEVVGFGGYVLKKLGDGIMALFGYPRAQENDAERAARAGLAILRALGELNARNTARGLPSLAARIGLDSGPVVIDPTGEVFGDAPNVAARVQAAADPGTLWVTANVHRQVAGLFYAEDKGSHDLKGVPGHPTLFQLLRASGAGRGTRARALTPLVGREEELAQLMRRWERACGGEAQLVQIVGEPGLGKSRLIEEFHARVASTPHTWVEWVSSQLLQNTPLHPVADWGKQRFGGAPRLADLEAALGAAGLDPAEHAPLLAPLLDIVAPPDRAPALGADDIRRRQLATIVAWLTASARQQPLVLAFEDMHWADPTTLDLMKTLAERDKGVALMMVATARPEFRAPWATRAHHALVSLVPLDRGQIRQMIGAIADRLALTGDAIEGLAERTGGVPLFIEEVTRLVVEGGAQTIPPTLQQSLAARLDRLGEAREVAQIGAVLGREFSYALLRAVADDALAPRPAESGLGLDAALEKLADADLLFVQGLAPESTYRFKHALIQDAAYESLLRAKRQALHRRAAKALAAAPDPQPELIAHHFTQGGQTEAAIAWWGQAGDAALRRGAFLEASAHLGKAIDLADGAAPAEAAETASNRDLRLKLQTEYVKALGWSRGFAAPETQGALARARELGAPLDGRAGNFAEFNALLIAMLTAGELRGAREAAERYLQGESNEAPSLETALAHRWAGFASIHLGDFEGARAYLETGMRLCDSAWNFETRYRYGADPAAVIPGYLSQALLILGETRRAVELLESALAVARRSNHLATLCSTLLIKLWFEIYRESPSAVLETSDELLVIAKSNSVAFFIANSEAMGDWARAKLSGGASPIATFRQALKRMRGQGIRFSAPRFEAWLAELEADRGDPETALRRIDKALAWAREMNNGGSLSLLHRVRGHILSAAPTRDDTGAEQAYARAIAVAHEQGARTFALQAALPLARLLQSSKRATEAHDVLAAALEGFELNAGLPAIPEARALLSEIESNLATKPLS